MGDWIPLLEGTDASTARAILVCLARELASQSDVRANSRVHASLGHGTLAQALLASYLRRWDDDLVDAQLVQSLISSAIRCQHGRRSGASLYFGAVGGAWLLHHLRNDALALDFAF